MTGAQIIDRIEKENFGLKLKIHFLEDALRRAGPGFNEAALQENTDLKVNGVTMQRELAKCKKTLIQAEQNLEAYRRHLGEVQAKAKRHQADESMRRELEELRKSLQEKEDEVEIFRKRLDAADRDKEEFNKLRGDIEDLEADIRDKDRQIDERDDEIDRIKEEAQKESEELDEVFEELEKEKKRIAELEAADQRKDDNADRLKEAQDELQDALAAQRKAETDLEEVRMVLLWYVGALLIAPTAARRHGQQVLHNKRLEPTVGRKGHQAADGCQRDEREACPVARLL